MVVKLFVLRGLELEAWEWFWCVLQGKDCRRQCRRVRPVREICTKMLRDSITVVTKITHQFTGHRSRTTLATTPALRQRELFREMLCRYRENSGNPISSWCEHHEEVKFGERLAARSTACCLITDSNFINTFFKTFITIEFVTVLLL